LSLSLVWKCPAHCGLVELIGGAGVKVKRAFFACAVCVCASEWQKAAGSGEGPSFDRRSTFPRLFHQPFHMQVPVERVLSWKCRGRLTLPFMLQGAVGTCLIEAALFEKDCHTLEHPSQFRDTALTLTDLVTTALERRLQDRLDVSRSHCELHQVFTV
jgi:hypothetical protein